MGGGGDRRASQALHGTAGRGAPAPSPAPVILDYLISGAATAADRGETGGLKQLLLRGIDDFALRAADVVVVDTDEHAEALPPRHRGRSVVIPVGAEERWFAAGEARRPRAVDDTGRLSVVFFGLFTPLQGTSVIARALRELDGLVEATIVGSGQDEAAFDELLIGVPGVTRVPWVEAEVLPDLVARHDLCLGVFGTRSVHVDHPRRRPPNRRAPTVVRAVSRRGPAARAGTCRSRT